MSASQVTYLSEQILRHASDLGVVGEASSEVEWTVASESSPLVCSFPFSALGGEGLFPEITLPLTSGCSTTPVNSASAADSKRSLAKENSQSKPFNFVNKHDLSDMCGDFGGGELMIIAIQA